MKITGVEPIVGKGNWHNWVFVKVTTDEGIVGWGDATNVPMEPVVAEAIRYIARYVIGESPLNIERLWNKMYIGMYATGKIVNSAIAGIEIALWDILGKVAGLPVYQLLGGSLRNKIRLYVHTDAYFEGDTMEACARNAKQFVRDGYTCVKAHPSEIGSWNRADVRLNRQIDNETIRNTVEKYRVIREAIGEDVDLCIDLNGQLNVTSNIRLGKALEPFNLLWYEDPINISEGVESVRRVKMEINQPICHGESVFNVWGFRSLLERNAVDIVHPDVLYSGGVLQTKKIASLAEAFNVPVAIHNVNSPFATIVSAHLASSIPNFIVLEYDHDDVEWSDKIISEPLKVDNGYLEVPTKPGWGVEIIEDEVLKHPYSLEQSWQGKKINNWVNSFKIH